MADTGTTLTLLSPREAAARLRALSSGGRGFLGTDPVVQNDALLAKVLQDCSALVMDWEGTVIGARPSPHNPRQEEVACSSDDPEALTALLDHLRQYRRCASVWAVCSPDAPMLTALEALEFRHTGLLRAHYYRAGEYLDAAVHYRDLEQL